MIDIVPGYCCIDVCQNKHSQEDLENYPAYLREIFEILKKKRNHYNE